MTPARAIQLVDKALAKYGRRATLSRSTATSDKRAGTVTTETNNQTVRVVTTEQKVESDEGLTYRITEARGRFSSEPKIGDTLTVDSQAYRIVCVNTKTLAGVAIEHVLELGLP
jgi:hypothetical protein